MANGNSTNGYQKKQTHEDGSIEWWRDVVGFEGSYRVSDRGRVRSLTRTIVFNRNGKRQTKVSEGRILNLYTNKRGYVNAVLGCGNTMRVHRLILEAFVGPCPEGMECRHLDGNPKNNVLSNLQWGTHQDNVEDKKSHGTFSPPPRHYGNDNSLSKLTIEKAREIRKLWVPGRHKGKLTQRKLAKMFGITKSTVQQVVNNHTWVE